MTLYPPPSFAAADAEYRPLAGGSAAAGANADCDPARSCTPLLLASLGPLLCLYRSADPHPLAGHRQARSLRAMVRLDSDGLREALLFFDAQHQPCWRLYLLPDSDCLAWERALSRLPCAAAPNGPWPALDDERLPSRCSLRNPAWRACALRLYAVPGPVLPCRLATSEVVLSVAGRCAAQRIAKADGAAPIVFAGASAPPAAPR